MIPTSFKKGDVFETPAGENRNLLVWSLWGRGRNRGLTYRIHPDPKDKPTEFNVSWKKFRSLLRTGGMVKVRGCRDAPNAAIELTPKQVVAVHKEVLKQRSKK